jgi:HAD superfamily hydrolase (TIGR01509 family)
VASPTGRVAAITLDFYGTLVYPRAGRGRGTVFMDYLREQGFESDPWEHQALYDIFERHRADYDPDAPVEQRERYHRRFTQRAFRRLNVRASGGETASDLAARHSAQIWSIFGPDCLAIYPDVSTTLSALREAGLPLALVSNWQCGLHHFCVELGLGDVFEHVLASAEVGYAKPDPRIFEEASRRLGRPPDRVLHVGDSVVDDLEGALGAGLQVVRVKRTLEQRKAVELPDRPAPAVPTSAGDPDASRADKAARSPAEGRTRALAEVPTIHELSELISYLGAEGADS